MNHDPDWKILIHFWNRLTPHQRLNILVKARLFKFEQQFYLGVIILVAFILTALVPIPRRIQPKHIHWL